MALLALALVATTRACPLAQATSGVPDAGTDVATLREGQRHFHRGLELYDEGDLGGAHAELERAYEIAPTYKILYNLGQISLRRQDWVAAERELRAYLAGGKTAIGSGRRREIADTLTHLSGRTASLEVSTDKPGARVILDDTNEIPLPLPQPLRVNVGHHVVTVIWPSGEREAKTLELAGDDQASLHFGSSPEPPAATAEAWAARAPGMGSPGRASTPLSALPFARLPSDESLPPTVLIQREGRTSHESEGPASHSSLMGVSWTATALVAAATGVTGALALRSSRTLSDARMSYPSDAATLADDAQQTRRLALTADILGAATAALGVLSLYLTFREH